MKKKLLSFVSLLLFASCAKEEFVANKAVNTYSVSSAMEYENKMCAQYSLIKPELDVLILWDNTSSGFSINSTQRQKLKELINTIATDRYNYNILNAPLVGNSARKLFTTSESTITSLNNTFIYKGTNQLNSFLNGLSFDHSSQGGQEQGVNQAVDIIKAHPTVFRKNAYTIVMVISNGDDMSYAMGSNADVTSPVQQLEHVNTLRDKLLCIRGNYANYSSLNCSSLGITSSHKLDAKRFKFLSVTPASGCSGHKPYNSYKDISKKMIQAPYLVEEAINVSLSESYDNYNLCDTSYPMFASLSEELKSTIDYHKYSYWPLTANSSVSIDLDSIKVYSALHGEIKPISNTNPTNGYTFYNLNAAEDDLIPATVNTRYYPSVGEPFTGKLIELHGNVGTLAGNCISVFYTEKKLNYGYVYMTAGKPNLSTMSVKYRYKDQSNWITIPPSSTNGWEYFEVASISPLVSSGELAMVNRPSNSNAPGHVVKLNGSYQLPNNGAIEFYVDYIPASASGNQ